jgi:predicted ribosome quality control (RQC) complex YloA/Tae2 family protein
MEVKIDFTKSAQDNADELYKKAKKFMAKKAGAEVAIKEMQKRLDAARSAASAPQAPRIVKAVKAEWYEKFHWFFTSTGMLAIGGRDAQQNEQVNSKYFGDNDLFFHADIFGASVVALQGGAKADAATREEVAQFAACYSNAWKQMLPSVDVYEMRREQVSKSSESGYLGKGSFLMKGERVWHRNEKIVLYAFVKDGRLNVAPAATMERLKPSSKIAVIKEGDDKKSDAAKRVAHILGIDNLDAVIRQLPSGTFSVSAKE